MPKIYSKIAASEAINNVPNGVRSVPRMYNPDLVTHRSFNPERGYGKAFGPNLADPTTDWDTTERTPDNIHNTALVLLREEMTTNEWSEVVDTAELDRRRFKYGVPFDMYVARAGNTTNVGEINKTRAYYADENGDAVGGSLANEPYHVNGWQYVYYIVATTNLLYTGTPNDDGTAYFFYEIYAGWANLDIQSGEFSPGTEVNPRFVHTDDNYRAHQRGVNLLGLSIPSNTTDPIMRYPNNNQAHYGTGYKGTDTTLNPDLEEAFRGLHRVSYGKVAMNFDSGTAYEMNPVQLSQTFLTDVRFADFNQYGRPSSVIACNNKYMVKFDITSYTAVESSVIGNSEPFENCPKTLAFDSYMKFADAIDDYGSDPQIFKFQFNPTGTRMYALGIKNSATTYLVEDYIWRFNFSTPFTFSSMTASPAEAKRLDTQDSPFNIDQFENAGYASRMREPQLRNGGCGSLEFNPQFLRDSNTGSITSRTNYFLLSFCNWRDTMSGGGGTVYRSKSAIAQYEFPGNSVANAFPTCMGNSYTGNNLIEDLQLLGLCDLRNALITNADPNSLGDEDLVRNFNPSYRFVRSGEEQDNNYSTARTNPDCFYTDNVDGAQSSIGIGEMVFATARRPIHDSFSSWTSTNNNRSRFEIMFQKRKLPMNNYIDGFNIDPLINTIDPMPVCDNRNQLQPNYSDVLYRSILDKIEDSDDTVLTYGIDYECQVMAFGNKGYYAFLMVRDDASGKWGIRRIELSEAYDITTRTKNNEQFRTFSQLGLLDLLYDDGDEDYFRNDRRPIYMWFGQITDEDTTNINDFGETLYIQVRGHLNPSNSNSPAQFRNTVTDGFRVNYRCDYIYAVRFTTLWDLTTASNYEFDLFAPFNWTDSLVFQDSTNNYISNIAENGSFPYYVFDGTTQRGTSDRIPVNRINFTNAQFFDNGYKVLLCINVANAEESFMGSDTFDEYWVQLHLDFPYDLISYQDSLGGVAKHDTKVWKKLAGKTNDPLGRKNYFDVVYGRGGWDPVDAQGVWGNSKYVSGNYGPLEDQLTSYARFEDLSPSFIQLINNGRTLVKMGNKGIVSFTNKKGTDWINPTSMSGTADAKFTQENRFGWTLSKQIKDRATLADKYRNHQQTLNFSRDSSWNLSKTGTSNYTVDLGDESGPSSINVTFMMKHKSRPCKTLGAMPTVVSEDGRFIAVCSGSYYTYPRTVYQMPVQDQTYVHRAFVRQLDIRKLVDT